MTVVVILFVANTAFAATGSRPDPPSLDPPVFITPDPPDVSIQPVDDPGAKGQAIAIEKSHKNAGKVVGKAGVLEAREGPGMKVVKPSVPGDIVREKKGKGHAYAYGLYDLTGTKAKGPKNK